MSVRRVILHKQWAIIEEYGMAAVLDALRTGDQELYDTVSKWDAPAKSSEKPTKAPVASVVLPAAMPKAPIKAVMDDLEIEPIPHPSAPRPEIKPLAAKPEVPIPRAGATSILADAFASSSGLTPTPVPPPNVKGRQRSVDWNILFALFDQGKKSMDIADSLGCTVNVITNAKMAWEDAQRLRTRV